MVAVALITGMDFATGVVGAVVMVLIASVAVITVDALGRSRTPLPSAP